MKHQYYFLIFIIGVILSNTVDAKVITVFNRLDLAVADYTTIQLAYDNATAGDTIMVYPSETPYGGIDISKKIILIGSGFTSTPDMPATKISGTVNFLTGSEGSVIESFGGEFNIIITQVNSIAIRKNLLTNIAIENSFNTFIISNISKYLEIKGNSLIEASNNIIKSLQTPISLEANSALNINNSIIANDDFGSVIKGGIVKGKNNLISQYEFFGNTYENSIVDFSYSLFINRRSDIYIFSELFNDGFHLKPDSPASGTGENGTDMGIYGGTTPFVDGGYPSIPIIYYLDVPLIGSQKDGINVTIKAKTN